jgi:hypothetical protein
MSWYPDSRRIHASPARRGFVHRDRQRRFAFEMRPEQGLEIQPRNNRPLDDHEGLRVALAGCVTHAPGWSARDRVFVEQHAHVRDGIHGQALGDHGRLTVTTEPRTADAVPVEPAE